MNFKSLGYFGESLSMFLGERRILKLHTLKQDEPLKIKVKRLVLA